MGHERRDGKVRAARSRQSDSDNPPAIGPAGTVHIRLATGCCSRRTNSTANTATANYSSPRTTAGCTPPCRRTTPWAGGCCATHDGSISLLTHTGSNGFWVADVRIVPKRNLIMLTALNAGGDAAEKADRDIGKALQDHLKAFD